VPVDLERELDRIYGVDLSEFVAERTSLANALKKEGRPAEAEQVKELRKPSLSVWAVNQLARRQRKNVDLLLDAGHRLAVAQRALLSGGDRDVFERASNAEREALTRLSQAARAILGERGSTATLERVTTTLRAAAVSDAARPDLARGRLTSDVDLAGFDAFTGASPPAPAKPAKAQRRRASDGRLEPEHGERRAAARRAAISRARAKLNSAKEREARLAKKLREVEREERVARVAYERAQRTAERTRGDHHAAASAVVTARAKLEEARRS
jgi:hypothetical protein